MAELPSADFLHRLADVADRETLPRFRTDLAVDSKFKEGYRFDPVTEADREAEIAIRVAIKAEYPDHAILGEELGQTGSGPYRWVLDPVDGTRPFICGLPVWGLQPYDIVALIPIIEKAGGVVTRIDGGRAEEGGPIIASATAGLHAAALHLLKNGG